MSEKPSNGQRVKTDRMSGRSDGIRTGAALFLLSTATVLFTLAVFRLLSFFIMPSLFFDLLFVGFPVGAFLGARFFRIDARSFRATLRILRAIMVLTVLALLACKHFDYLRAHLFDVRLDRLLVQMGVFTGLFLPFFCAYGLSEYVGYQVGRQSIRGRMAIVYALYLFGAALAYLVVDSALARLGVARLLLAPIAMVAICALLVGRPRLRGWSTLELALLAIALAMPGLEPRFLDLYKGEGAGSTREYARNGHRMMFQKWGRYSLTEVMQAPGDRAFVGFYNDLMQWEFELPAGFQQRCLGMIPLDLAPAGSTIAIIGAGGGRQVQWALRKAEPPRRIVAIELEPAVFEAVRGPLAGGFGRVYESDRVLPVRSEARGYMERTEERFDLIYLPSVGGYPQMMLEPGNMIRTLDAYRVLVGRLNDRGILAIWYPRGLDRDEILTRQYVLSLRSEEMGLRVAAFRGEWEYLILATRDETRLPDVDDIVEFLRSGDPRPDGLRPVIRPRPATLSFDTDGSDFRAIRDDQPFLAGNLSNVFSVSQVWTLFGLAIGTLCAIGVAVIVSLRRSGNPAIRGRSYPRVCGLAFLLGANFLVLEHQLILTLFRRLYVFHDSVLLGAIGFLVLSGLGSVCVRARWRMRLAVLGVLTTCAFVLLEPELSAPAALGLAAPAVFVTGSFFPALFELARRNPLAVFALDAVGAAFGSVTAFFLPLAFGFRCFFPVAGIVFCVTAFATWRFFRGIESPTGERTA